MKKLLTIITLVVCQSSLNAQCITDQYYLGNDNKQSICTSDTSAANGQSFRSTYNASLSKVALDLSASNTGCSLSTIDVQLDIIDGDGVSGTVLGSEVFTIPSDFSRTLDTFTLTNPVPMVASQMYTIRFTLLPNQDCGGGVEPNLIWYFEFPTNYWTSTGGTQYQGGVITSLGNTQYFSTCVQDCILDVSVTDSASTLTANATNVVYQWLYCDSNYAEIPGENFQSFSPTTPGNYAVKISYGSCSDTSDCFLIDFASIEELTTGPKKLIKIVDYMGRETAFKTNTPLIFIYSDGTRERVMKIEE